MGADNVTVGEDDDEVIAHGISVFKDHRRELLPYRIVSEQKPPRSTIGPHLSSDVFARRGSEPSL